MFPSRDQEKMARKLLGSLPERWGRMDVMSRAALLGGGQALSGAGLLHEDTHVLHPEYTGGLIVGSRRGSLATDLHYAATLEQGRGMASPHLFGYTLPNIALAEAAIVYHLTGPVFVLIDEDPYAKAVHEARQWLPDLPGEQKILVAGALDVIPGHPEPDVTARFTIIQE